MQDLNDKITGNTLTAAEWNEVPSEIQNAIESAGITLSGGDLFQLTKAISAYAAGGSFYTDSGAVNTVVLSPVGSKLSPPSYFDGMRVDFKPAVTNTGATTVNVAGLGVKNITGTSGGELEAGINASIRYNNASGNFDIISVTSSIGGTSSLGNRLINGNFNINQRVVTGSVVLAVGEYGHDRWRAGAGGCSYTFATSSNVTTLTITAGTLEQEVKGGNVTTNDFVLSWVGTAQGRIDGGSYGTSGNVTDALTGGTNTTVEFDTGTLTQVQLEEGTIATPFEFRFKDFELELCRAYYEKSYLEGTPDGTSTDAGLVYLGFRTATTGCRLTFKTEKQSGAPTMTYRDRLGNLNRASFRQTSTWFDNADVVTAVNADSKGTLVDVTGSGNGNSLAHFIAEDEL